MKAIFVIFLGIFALLGVATIGQKALNIPTSKITPQPSDSQERVEVTSKTSVFEIETGQAGYYITPQEATLNKGDILKLTLMLKSDEVILSAGAIRLLLTLQEGLSLKPSDASTDKDGIQVNTDSQTKDGGFSFPVNEVEINASEKRGKIDLAIVNLSPEGFRAKGEYSVASIDLVAESGGTLTLEFDKNLTKLVDKRGNEVPLNLRGGKYFVK